MSEYEVEAIIGRKVFSGKVLYLTKWKNFSVDEATWESVKVLKDYRYLIRAYNEKNRTESSPFSFQDNEDVDDEQVRYEKKDVATCDDEHGSKKDQRSPIAEIAPVIENRKLNSNEIYSFQENKRGAETYLRKKRGRPSKLQKAAKMGLTYQNTNQKPNSKSIQFLKKVSQIYHQKYERKDDVKLQESQQKAKPEKNVKLFRKQALEYAEVSEYEQPLAKIYLVERKDEGECQYIVETIDGKFRRCGTSEMVKLYAQQLVNFLEESLIKRTTNSVSIL